MKKLILATTASLALAFSVSAQTASYSAEQINRGATKGTEKNANATKFTEAPAIKAAGTTTVVSKPATSTTVTAAPAATPATTATTAAPVAKTTTTAPNTYSAARVNAHLPARPEKAGPGNREMPAGRVKVSSTSKSAPLTGSTKK